MKKYLTIILLAMLTIRGNAQEDSNKREVVVIKTEDVLNYYKNIVFTSFIQGLSEIYEVKSQDLTEQALKEIIESQTEAKDGLSDKETASQLGKKFNAKIICYITVRNAFDNKVYISARLAYIETLQTINAVHLTTDNEENNIIETCKKLAYELVQDVNTKLLNFDNTGTDKQTEGIIKCYRKFEVIYQPDWVHIKQESHELFGKILVVTCPQNRTISEKKGKILLLFEKEREVAINIFQSPPPKPVDKDYVDFDKRGGDAHINLLVNFEEIIDIIMPENIKKERLDLIPNRTGGYLTIHTENNRGYKKLDETITIKFKDKKQQGIRVVQEKGDFLEKKELIIKTNDPNPISVEVYDKISAKITPENNSNWLNLNIKTEADKKYLTIKWTAYKTDNKKNRTDTILVNINEWQETIIVKQEPQPKAKSFFRLKTTAGANANNEYRTVATDIGLSLGYSLQGWNLCNDKNSELSQWEQPQRLGGFLGGFRFNHFFTPEKFPWGIDWGLYYNYVFAKNKSATNPLDVAYSYDIQKHIVYVPFHLIFKFDFHKTFGLVLYGGVGMNIGLMEKISAVYPNETEPFYNLKEKIFASTLERFNMSYEYGAGVQLPHCLLSVGMSNRFFSSGQEIFTKKQKQGLIVSLTVMFGTPAGYRIK